MRALPPLLPRAGATAPLLLGAATAILVVVPATNFLGDALAERLATRRAAR